MKTIELQGIARDTGKIASKNLRHEGNVPCVMYGSKEPSHFFLNEVALKAALWTPEVFIVQIDIDGKKTDTVIRDAQFHPVTDRCIHVDFLRVSDKAVDLELPIVLNGTAPGIMAGGRLQQLLRKIRLKGIPSDMPSEFEVDVSNLELGQSIKVGDMSLDKFDILTDPGVAIVSVKIARAAVTAEEEGEEGEGEEGEEGVTPAAEGDKPADTPAE